MYDIKKASDEKSNAFLCLKMFFQITFRFLSGKSLFVFETARFSFCRDYVVLEKRVRPDGSAVWNVEDDDSYMLEKSNDEWIVSRRGKVVYSSTGFENIIKADFKNNKGEQLSAKFFTKAGVAQVTYLGVDYLLYQYVTASGYGYKNSFIDIRGKGKDMTLTFVGKDSSVEFTEQ